MKVDFPVDYNKTQDENMKEFLIKSGYPKKFFDSGDLTYTTNIIDEVKVYFSEKLQLGFKGKKFQGHDYKRAIGDIGILVPKRFKHQVIGDTKLPEPNTDEIVLKQKEVFEKSILLKEIGVQLTKPAIQPSETKPGKFNIRFKYSYSKFPYVAYVKDELIPYLYLSRFKDIQMVTCCPFYVKGNIDVNIVDELNKDGHFNYIDTTYKCFISYNNIFRGISGLQFINSKEKANDVRAKLLAMAFKPGYIPEKVGDELSSAMLKYNNNIASDFSPANYIPIKIDATIDRNANTNPDYMIVTYNYGSLHEFPLHNEDKPTALTEVYDKEYLDVPIFYGYRIPLSYYVYQMGRKENKGKPYCINGTDKHYSEFGYIDFDSFISRNTVKGIPTTKLNLIRTNDKALLNGKVPTDRELLEYLLNLGFNCGSGYKWTFVENLDTKYKYKLTYDSSGDEYKPHGYEAIVCPIDEIEFNIVYNYNTPNIPILLGSFKWE